MSQSLPLQGGEASPETSRGGSRLLTIFSLPFCAVGIWMAGSFFVALGRSEPLDEGMAARAVLGLTFGVAGFGLLFYARWAGGQLASRDELRARHPDEPWRWRPEWDGGRVPAQDGAVALVAVLFAVVWNAISAPLAWQIPRELAKGNGAAAWGLLFPLVGVGLAIWAVRATLRRRRFGRCVFELATLPGVIGGPFRGTLHVPTLVRPEAGFLVTLTCVHRVKTGHGKNRSTHESVRWQERATVPPTRVMAAASGSAFPVEFTVPGDAPPSSPVSSDDEHVWRLAASAEVPGIDFHTSFEVPVFRTSETRDDLRTTTLDVSDDEALSAVPAPVAPGGRITAAATPAGVEVYFPAARSPSSAVAITLMALFWNGLVGFMAMEAHVAVLLFLSIFLLLGLVIAIAALNAWLGTIRLRARSGELEVTRKLLGVGRTRVRTAAELSGLRIEPNGRIGKRVLYALEFDRPGRKKPSTLADGLGDRREAERVLRLLRDALQLGD